MGLEVYNLTMIVSICNSGKRAISSSVNYLASVSHNKAVTSALFSPDGTHFVALCNDDHIRVFPSSLSRTTNTRPISTLRHNNQTGIRHCCRVFIFGRTLGY